MCTLYNVEIERMNSALFMVKILKLIILALKKQDIIQSPSLITKHQFPSPVYNLAAASSFSPSLPLLSQPLGTTALFSSTMKSALSGST